MHKNLMAPNLKSFAELMDEAATVIRAMPPDVFDRLEVRHWLCDELEGSAGMLRDAAQEAGIAPESVAPNTGPTFQCLVTSSRP